MDKESDRIFITPRVKEIVELAQLEANRLGSKQIKPAHIFIATLTRYQRNDDQKTACGRLLTRAGITPEKARRAFLYSEQIQ
jgi:hypothetical protein